MSSEANFNQNRTELLEKATVRKARTSDYTSVVDGIGDVYNGWDELPDMFMEFLEDDDVESFVLELEGHGVVGFYAAHYVDAGETQIKRSGRIHPDFRGLGLFRHLSKFLVKDAKERGTVKMEVMMALKPNAPRLKNTDYHTTHSVDMYIQSVETEDIPYFQPSEYANIHKMTSSDMELFLSTEKIWNKIAPFGFIWIGGTKLRKHKANTKRLINDKSSCYMSFEDHWKETKAQEEARLTKASINKLSMISACYRVCIKTGILNKLYFLSDDFNHLLPHIKFHLSKLKSYGANKTHIEVFIHPHRRQYVGRKAIDIFKRFGVTLQQDPALTTGFIFERIFNSVL